MRGDARDRLQKISHRSRALDLSTGLSSWAWRRRFLGCAEEALWLRLGTGQDSRADAGGVADSSVKISAAGAGFPNAFVGGRCSAAVAAVAAMLPSSAGMEGHVLKHRVQIVDIRYVLQQTRSSVRTQFD